MNTNIYYRKKAGTTLDSDSHFTDY